MTICQLEGRKQGKCGGKCFASFTDFKIITNLALAKLIVEYDSNERYF